jgi:hypothetical protein
VILVAGVIIVFATVPLLGGHLQQAGSIRFARKGLLAAALVLQILVLQVFAAHVPPWMAASLHLASYAAAVAFLWSNRAVPGLWLIGLGGMANFAAIAANGGVMPASPTARAAAGLASEAGFSNSAAIANPRLAFLGDVFAWPAPLPLANVFSIGDVLLLLGAAVLVHRVGGSRLSLRLGRRPVRL